MRTDIRDRSTNRGRSMQRSTDRILTTHPGRLPDPDNRDEVIDARNAGDQARFDAGIKVGAAQMFAKQREAGIDIMSDGEFWKERDGIYYNSRVSGIESVPLKPGEPVSTVIQQRERRMPEFRQIWEIWDQVGNTPRPGVVNVRPTDRYVMAGPVKSKGPEAINHEIAVVKEAL